MQNNPVEHTEVNNAAERKVRGVRVVAKALSKSYGGREVLKVVELDVEPGEFVAIVGRSGCGKSTLLRLIAKLETATQGEVAFAQHGADKRQPGFQPETRIMFQDSRLLPWKRVLNNVALGLSKAALPAASQALRQVGLEERAGEWPAVLSGGQRQRVALARALVHDPELLLLDEPLGALDALTRIEMQQLIESLWQKRSFTAVLVTHDVQEAIALADRVVLIEDGRITLDQPVDLPRPRARGNPAFARLEEYILSRVLQHPASAPDSSLGDISLQKTVSQVQWAI
ncbi:ATP-binding cassette domain-containing protein [Herbaspirillum sp. RV1423]|uniref:ATP-binding cassette domain-containing protein n=1 Tax=Herbaspirillum sp. RV1423 TaxID=1443993 RepID=UPI0005521767|nr:ATP-binding cassette domain-containing protein [Herbaspirillum sp. RV1423]